MVLDPYGRAIPQHSTGSVNLGKYTSSTRLVMEKAMELFDRITDPVLLVRRVTVVANHVLLRQEVPQPMQQLDLFADYEQQQQQAQQEGRELRRQEAVLQIQQKFGKNSILKGMNYQQGATTRQRNGQVGGHRK